MTADASCGKRSCLFGLVAAAASMAAAPLLAGQIISSPTFVYVHPEKSHLWSTVTSQSLLLNIDYPEGATSATLNVIPAKGQPISYANIADGQVSVELPPATSLDTENVYAIDLTFDNGVRRVARIGHVNMGADADRNVGSTRAIGPKSAAWGEVYRSAVIPTPYGVTEVTVNGESVDAGFGGAAGWFFLDKPDFGPSGMSDIAMSTVNGDFNVRLRRIIKGLAVCVR